MRGAVCVFEGVGEGGGLFVCVFEGVGEGGCLCFRGSG